MESRDTKAAQFTHPSDFAPSSVPGLSDLDNVLRCQVCKDYFETPSVTSCSHTFCSMCIRQALSSSGQCPTCRKKDQTVHLRRNWPIQEAVAAWKKVRADILVAVTTAGDDAAARLNGDGTGQEANRKSSPPVINAAKKRAIDSVDDVSESPRYKTRSKRHHDHTTNQTNSAFEGLTIVEDDDEDGDYQDEARNITSNQAAQAAKAIVVSCPICDEEMLEAHVFGHLDHCTGAKSSKVVTHGSRSVISSNGETKRPSPASNAVPPKAAAPPQPTIDRSERITFLSYDMMKEAALKKKLQQLGIRADGNKALMKARHMYWVDLFNANVDADTPRPRRELLDDLAVWERAIGRNQTGGATQGQANGIMRKDFDREGYQTQNTSQFNDLIAQARNSIKSKSPAPPPTRPPSSGDAAPGRAVQPLATPSPAESMFLGAAAQLNAATAARRGSNAIQYLSSPTHLQQQHSSSSAALLEGNIRQMPMFQMQEYMVKDMDEDIK